MSSQVNIAAEMGGGKIVKTPNRDSADLAAGRALPAEFADPPLHCHLRHYYMHKITMHSTLRLLTAAGRRTALNDETGYSLPANMQCIKTSYATDGGVLAVAPRPSRWIRPDASVASSTQ